MCQVRKQQLRAQLAESKCPTWGTNSVRYQIHKKQLLRKNLSWQILEKLFFQVNNFSMKFFQDFFFTNNWPEAFKKGFEVTFFGTPLPDVEIPMLCEKNYFDYFDPATHILFDLTAK